MIIAISSANAWELWLTVRRYREDGYLLTRKRRVRPDCVALWFEARA